MEKNLNSSTSNSTIEIVKKGTEETVGYACSTCGKFYSTLDERGGLHMAEICCSPCPRCTAPRDAFTAHIHSVCDKCRTREQLEAMEKAAQARLDKAMEIEACAPNWDTAIYYNDEFCYDFDILLDEGYEWYSWDDEDNLEIYEDLIPQWAHPCVEYHPSVEDMLDSIHEWYYDRLDTEAGDGPDINAAAEANLRAACEEFLAAHEHNYIWRIDYSRKMNMRPLIVEALKDKHA